ncbi:hypothetical protein EUX98_g7210 [Antrodiella citrinella]|uniref:Protein kinase domain-containing protein n=1 Tax=Antrodiella citrinella TaxID=2447956 RepID=A0A4S4MNU3_9APHY|nr:hypothetical protein EUX98_g7210 [Antrodiella citrinella]
MFNPFSTKTFRKREGDSDRLRHPITSRRTSETPEQRVTRLVTTSLETDDYSEVLNFVELEARLAAQIIQEMLEPPFDESKAMTVLARNKLRVLWWKLGLKNDILPETMFLQEVKCEDGESRFSGGFADIFCGTYKGEKVALKRLRYYTKLKESQKSKLRLGCFRESLLWRTLDHRHVLTFLGISDDAFEHTPCIVLPWIKNGNILQFMDVLKVQGKFSGPELVTTTNQWLFEVSQGVAYLHGEDIVHGDLRGINILIDSESVACVTNFDLAVVTNTVPLDDTLAQVGPIRWRCPELLEPEDLSSETSPLTFASDVYSFACMAIELYTGQPPFFDLNSDHQVFLKVLEGRRPSRPSISEGAEMSDHLWALMLWCWSAQPSDRPAISQVVQTMALACPQWEIPSTLFVKGVKCLEKESMAGGAFADIFVGEYEGKKVALKRLKLYQKTEEWKKLRAKRSFYRETLIWSTLKHEHILPFLGVDASNFKHSLCMVLPFMDHGNIRDCIMELKNSNRFHDGVLRVTSWVSQIAQGLAFLHSKTYVHGDLRGANILIDEEWKVRLADFGLAIVAEPTTGSYRTSSNGAIRWLAPELLDPEEYKLTSARPTYAGDVYAFACVCLEIYTCHDPFQGLTDYLVLRRVVEGQRPERPTHAQGSLPVSDGVWDLCERCWAGEPAGRPVAQTLVDEMKVEMESLGL